MNGRLRLLMVVAFAETLAQPARATEHPRVQMVVDPCVDTPAAEVRRLLAIDLGALLVDPALPSADATRATVGCDGTLTLLRVDDPVTGKSLTREVDIASSPPNARARLVALAVSELISASWTELATNPAPAVPPAGTPAPPEARRSALAVVERRSLRVVPPPPRLRLVAFGSAQALFNRFGLMLGAGLRVGQDRPSGLAWAVDVVEHHGAGQTALGTVAVDTLGVGPMLFFHHAWTHLGIRIGGGARGGLARLDGQPDGPRVHGQVAWGGWLGPLAALALTAEPARGFALEVALEAGYVAVPFGGRVDGERQVAVDGPWIGFQLGVGLFPRADFGLARH